MRAERLDNPTDFIPPILARVKPEYVRKQYGLPEWTDAADFVAQLAKKTGKLMKGGEMDLNNVAVSVINDFQRVREQSILFKSCFYVSQYRSCCCRVSCRTLCLLPSARRTRVRTRTRETR